MSDIKKIAQQYIDAGWAVLPLVKGEKRATGSWQKTQYTASQFKDGDGIGGKCGEPSGWRVDVDLDSGEAIAAAKLLLPNTGLIHGRPGKPDSHYWFISEGAKSAQEPTTGNVALEEDRNHMVRMRTEPVGRSLSVATATGQHEERCFPIEVRSQTGRDDNAVY